MAEQVWGATVTVNAGASRALGGAEGRVQMLIRTDDPDVYLGASYISSSGQGYALLPGQECRIEGWQPVPYVYNDGANPATVTVLVTACD